MSASSLTKAFRMTGRPARTKKAGRVVRRFTVAGALDVHAAEALELEIRRFAKRHGVEITWRRVARDRNRSSSV